MELHSFREELFALLHDQQKFKKDKWKEHGFFAPILLHMATALLDSQTSSYDSMNFFYIILFIKV